MKNLLKWKYYLESLNSSSLEEYIKHIIESIPDSDIPSETSIITEFEGYIIYTEGWCDRCFSNYDTNDREDKVELARKIGKKRLEDIPKLPQYYKQFSGEKLVDYQFIELPDNDINYCLSIGIYK